LLFLPNERQSAREADVIAVGPEVRDVSVGAIVIVNALSGQQVGDELILPESAVLGFAEVAA
jgi:co-chaperonin GroES (HSP10)